MVKSTQPRDAQLTPNFLRIRISVKLPFCITVPHSSGCAVVSIWPVAWVRLRHSREGLPGWVNKGTCEVTGYTLWGDVRAVQLSPMSSLNINMLSRH